MTRTQKERPIYRARPDLEGNRAVAERTDDDKVLRLVPPRRQVRWVGYRAARKAAA